MEQLLVNYKVHEVIEYINWLYFFHAWGFAPRYATIAHVHDCAGCRASWLASFTTDEQLKAREAIKLITDARNMLEELEGQLTCKCTFQLFDAQAQGDNLMIGSTLFPLLRQQNANNKENICLCISDFIKPIELNIQDKIGVFAATVNDTTIVSSEDDYHNLLVQTLCDRLVEAAVEKLHLYVRKEAWGYAPDEHLSIPELLQEKFQGIRPAVGYPSLPDQSVNFIIDQLIDFSKIGISLTEYGAMHPHASVSGLMLAHQQARYFSVGKIGEDQLIDYSHRRGLPVESMRKFLAANL